MQSLSMVFLFGIITSLLCNLAMADSNAPTDSSSHNLYAADLFSVVVDNKSTENVVFSPASIQTCLALAFAGAEGQTAEEMRRVLKLGEGDKTDVIKKYGEFLKTTFKTDSATTDGPQLKTANRFYVNDHLEVLPHYKNLTQEYFNSRVENINFADSGKAVANINNWVEQQTDSKIKDLLQPDDVSGDTSAILVNAIYFKAQWLRPFSESSTEKSTFYISSKQQKEVDMMYTDDRFRFVYLSHLKASALEMPYKNSDISMLIILPDKIDGLKELESQLVHTDLNNIATSMTLQKMEVFLPKFRIEFNIDLKNPLKKMGLNSIFSTNANFSGLFNTSVPQQIADVKHKAFLDVNEAGSEAAAATYLKIVPMSMILDQKIFRADHPFVFAIRNKDAVYFMGHVTTF